MPTSQNSHYANTYIICRTIYEKLSSAVSEEQKAVYLQRVEEISPNIRYCAYNIGDTPTDINQIMKMRNVSDMVASKINVSVLTYLLCH